MCFVLFLVLALKCPVNPPAVGDPETIYYRQSLYVVYLAISGFTALGVAFMYGKMRVIQSKKVMILLAIYAVIIVASYLALSPNPDAINALIELVSGFRIASGFTMSIFWGLLGIILGTFWDRTKTHEKAEIATV